MRDKFRGSMSWLHTWSGLIIGWLLFAIFFTGTYSYFRSEITYWMQPELHSYVPNGKEAALAYEYLQKNAPDATAWSISLPTSRNNVLSVSFRNPTPPNQLAEQGMRRMMTTHYLDSETGERLIPRDTAGGNFLYRFHIELYGMDRMTGRFIVGIATMFMFIAIITGIIFHKRIFADFFTFRRNKGTRSWIDAHIFTAVLALPFHLMITYSGLVLLMMVLLPWNTDGFRRNAPARATEGYQERVQPQVQRTNNYPDITALIEDAEERLQSKVQRISISNPGQRRMIFEMASSKSNIISTGRGGGSEATVVYMGERGRFAGFAETEAANFVAATNNVLSSLHLARYADTFTRWLFFISGALGTIMVGTGMIIWANKKSGQINKSIGRKLVDVLNVGGIAGLTAATGILFWANRLLPVDLVMRSNWEIRIFFISWLLLALYPVIRPAKKAWVEELALCAALYGLLPVLQAFTSSSNFFTSLSNGNYILAGFDLTVLGLGILFGYGAWKTATHKPADKKGLKTPAAEGV